MDKFILPYEFLVLLFGMFAFVLWQQVRLIRRMTEDKMSRFSDFTSEDFTTDDLRAEEE